LVSFLINQYVCLIFTGPPGRPKGPLEVADITKNSAKLAWKEPEDDGGQPIE
jgi:hypothetical protein